MLLVQKFGGTSVGSIERIENVARIIKSELDAKNEVIVITSAMAGTTNKLIALGKNFKSVTSITGKREHDAIAATGEIISAALVSLALQDIAVNAISLSGWQAGITTDKNFSEAEIININKDKILNLLKEKIVPVITGFQGVYNDNITTLGRGGSDTSAVAIAAAVEANRCDIYTDVDGIYSADPNIILEAKK